MWRGPSCLTAFHLHASRGRAAVTQIKVSGCHRSTTGAHAWLRIRGYISPVRKHGDNVFTALHDAVTGNP